MCNAGQSYLGDDCIFSNEAKKCTQCADSSYGQVAGSTQCLPCLIWDCKLCTFNAHGENEKCLYCNHGLYVSKNRDYCTLREVPISNVKWGGLESVEGDFICQTGFMKAKDAEGKYFCKELIKTACKDIVGCSTCDEKTGKCIECDFTLGYVYSKAEQICYHDIELVWVDSASLLKTALASLALLYALLA